MKIKCVRCQQDIFIGSNDTFVYFEAADLDRPHNINEPPEQGLLTPLCIDCCNEVKQMGENIATWPKQLHVKSRGRLHNE